ncbi:hypothetical protein [Nitrosophilus alvini]|uniref:hypothetical protein n=1 Tax=Nitrosophilus alvini TaxID=2714855 RepID=UPI001909BB19|nr:hypothetical protein [Nitrosophilus alvini]
MSVIGYREWNIWTNLDFFNDTNEIFGVAHFKITPSLMAEQTVKFIYEKIEYIRQGGEQFEDETLKNYFDLTWITSTNELIIQKRSSIITANENIKEFIKISLYELEALSLSLDFPLTCNEIKFYIPPTQPFYGIAFVASRTPLTRGIGFEIEERNAASLRLTNNFNTFMNLDPIHRVATRHYLTGLTILGLEDQFSGLIDAAFMQFYQASEILCGENYKLKDVKIYIAKNFQSESRDLQVIAHHVWQVRHTYFGHGNAKNIENIESTFNIAKQVLVARWLSKRLLDLTLNSTPLIREMRLYHKGNSIGFTGTLAEIKNTFYCNYDFTDIEILDQDGKIIETINIVY